VLATARRQSGVIVATQVDPEWWSSGLWNGRPIGEFLRRRDVTAVFRFLHARGVSYGRIAALVGVSANRAAEIAKGVRQVTAYEVLERIAAGLDIPRPAMGLGRDEDAVVHSDFGPVAVKGGADPLPASVEISDLVRLRLGLNEALASASVAPRQLELIEQAAGEHMRVYPSASPQIMLSLLAAECREVRVLSLRRQPAALQSRLSGVAALLATMCADALMRLGDVSEARRWYGTAIHAADDSGRARLRVLVRAQAAMLPYYFGDPTQTVALADAALAVTSNASSAGALAAAGRARALARIGAIDQARSAIDQARRLFDHAGDEDTDVAFRFPAKRLLFYLSGAYTWLGDTVQAYRVQDEALRLYGAAPAVPIDVALIALDRSMCLAQDRRATEAALTARDAIADLPETQRTEIILTRATDVATAIPEENGHGEVASLTDYLRACRERARSLGITAALGP
jgi:tetratricopeptide (TPR) repeat protein